MTTTASTAPSVSCSWFRRAHGTKTGLRYTQFHSTALCSPSRAALITGRNHHSVGFGVISEQATGYPGYNSTIGGDSATVGRVLKDNGYATSWFGKNHNTPDYQYSTAGPFDQWPSGMGFDYFYAMTNAYGLRASLGMSYDLTDDTTLGAYYQTRQHFRFEDAVRIELLNGQLSGLHWR